MDTDCTVVKAKGGGQAGWRGTEGNKMGGPSVIVSITTKIKNGLTQEKY